MNKLLTTSAVALIAVCGTTWAWAQPINESELSDPRVRQAIAYAIDMETIAETLFEGAAIPAIGLTSDPANYPEGMNTYSYNPERARELLAEAGWDGSRTLDMVYYYPDQLTADFMAVVQAQLADVGIDMTYRLLEGDVGAQITGRPADPVNGPSVVEWDMLYGARAAIANQEYFNRFAEGQMPMIPTVEEKLPLVEQVNGTVDPAVQRAGYQHMEGIINENVYILPLYYQQTTLQESLIQVY